MKRWSMAAFILLAAMVGQAAAQQLIGIEALRTKNAISDVEAKQLYDILLKAADAMVTNTDPDRKGMVANREAIVAESKNDTQTPAFRQAFGEQAARALAAVDKKAVGEAARVNLLMAAAELKRPELIPMLISGLEREPWEASRYWCAKGLSMAGDVVVERNLARVQSDMADAAAKAFQVDQPDVVALQLFEMLGKFDDERWHDVLVDGVTRYVQRAPASDPIVAQSLVGVVSALERAYSREVRPEAKTRILSALATLCAWVMPPVGQPTLMARLNASLELITNDRVGFLATDEAVTQKMSLMEWVEKLFRDKRIPKRPTLPPAIEDATKSFKQSSTAPAATP